MEVELQHQLDAAPEEQAGGCSAETGKAKEARREKGKPASACQMGQGFERGLSEQKGK